MNYKIDSATGVLREVLMCEPTWYDWLPSSEIARASISAGIIFDRERALQQHQALVHALQTADVECHFVEPDAQLPDLCWTRDSSQVTPWGPVITRLSNPERRPENDVLRRFYERSGQDMCEPVSAGPIEGGDIHIIRPGLLAIGYSDSRTSRGAAIQFSDRFVAEGWEVRLQPVDDRFVHLDVLFCMAADNLAVASTEVVGDEFSDWLHSNGIQVIPVSVDETDKLACNCLALGERRVVVGAKGLEMSRRLRTMNIDVVELDLDMFTMAGGGAHCLTQPLRRDPTH